jgi:isochorismate synthase
MMTSPLKTDFGPSDLSKSPHSEKAPLTEARFLFRSGTRSLHASGVVAVIDTPARGTGGGSDSFVAAVNEALAQARRAGIAQPIVMGAIPFDTTQPSCLYVPRQHAWQDQQARPEPFEQPAPMAHVVSQHSLPDAEGFKAGVSAAIEAFGRGDLRKVVLSRRLDVQLDTPVDVDDAMARLATQNPHGYHFRVPLPGGGDLIGVSPELLLRKQHGNIFSNPLAGSAKRREDPSEDQAVGLALLDSIKDH